MDTAIKSWKSAWLSAGRSKTSMENMERNLRLFGKWLEGTGRRRYGTASRDDCQDFITSRRAVGDSTAHMAWRALRSF